MLFPPPTSAVPFITHSMGLKICCTFKCQLLDCDVEGEHHSWCSWQWLEIKIKKRRKRTPYGILPAVGEFSNDRIFPKMHHETADCVGRTYKPSFILHQSVDSGTNLRSQSQAKVLHFQPHLWRQRFFKGCRAAVWHFNIILSYKE